MSPNNETLLNDVQDLHYLILLLLFGFFIYLHFLLPHIAHFDNIIAWPLLVLDTFGFILSVFFLHFKQQDKIVLYFKL